MSTSSVKLSSEDNPSSDDVDVIERGLVDHTVEMEINRDSQPINLFFRNQEGTVLAGCLGRTCYGWLSISKLWVDKECRGQGLGTKLIKEAERLAIERGCKMAHTDTYSYQAPDFYKGLGYTVFGERADCPDGHTKYYLKKVLG